MRLAEYAYRTVDAIRGPLVFFRQLAGARAGELVRIVAAGGRASDGEVLAISGDTVLVQVFGETRGLSLGATVVSSDRLQRVPLTTACLGRVFNGSCEPLDNGPPLLAREWGALGGAPLNPTARARPEEFIETGFTAIDLLNTLVKGQKLPVFSCAGLPSRELAVGILENARLADGGAFALVFVALGVSHHEYACYLEALQRLRTDFVAFVNRAGEPVVERLLAPRLGLAMAEYLAYRHGRDVLVLISDMANYCDALREVSTAREELPGRRGYPGYLYSDLASLYERAGRIRGQTGSVTMLPILTMPEDDITHPIPDLTGYITEGQLVLSRDLHRQGVFPPIDVLPSLSRLMQHGIGAGRTRGEHRRLADLLYRFYAKGRDLRRLASIVGRDGLLASDRELLDFADAFEQELIGQGTVRRDIGASLAAGSDLLARFGLETP